MKAANNNRLLLTITAKWYDMIESGIKKHEYREIKPHWISRLEGRSYIYVEFKNGYNKNSRKMKYEVKKITKGQGNPKWGAKEGQEYYIIHLGKKLSPDFLIDWDDLPF